MLKKRYVVENTDDLKSLLTNVEVSEGDVLLRSDQYLQIGCDLRDLGSLDRTLASSIDMEQCKKLPSRAARRRALGAVLVKWASKKKEAMLMHLSSGATHCRSLNHLYERRSSRCLDFLG